MKHKNFIKYAAPVIWLVFILLLSGQSGDRSSAASLNMALWIRDFFGLPYKAGEINDVIRTFAHIFVFGVEGVLVLNAIKNRPLTAFLLCSALAALDEMHKIPIPGRHCHPNEIILNIAAAGSGILIAGLIQGAKTAARKTS